MRLAFARLRGDDAPNGCDKGAMGVKSTAIAAALATMVLLGGCADGDWKGTAYPDKYDRSQPIDLGTFNSFEACQKAGKKKASQLGGGGAGSDYECGYKCRFDLDTKSTLCEDTRK